MRHANYVLLKVRVQRLGQQKHRAYYCFPLINTHNFLSASPHSPFCLPSRITKRKADKGRSYLLQQKLFEDCCADAELPAPPPFPILYAKGEEEAGIAEVSAQHRRIVSDVKNTTFLCKSSSC